VKHRGARRWESMGWGVSERGVCGKTKFRQWGSGEFEGGERGEKRKLTKCYCYKRIIIIGGFYYFVTFLHCFCSVLVLLLVRIFVLYLHVHE